jgi:hypothetical protein
MANLEKFMTKAQRYGLRDVLTGKLSIPKADEKFDNDLEMGKIKQSCVHRNLLSIDVKTRNGEIAFNIL